MFREMQRIVDDCTLEGIDSQVRLCLDRTDHAHDSPSMKQLRQRLHRFQCEHNGIERSMDRVTYCWFAALVIDEQTKFCTCGKSPDEAVWALSQFMQRQGCLK